MTAFAAAFVCATSVPTAAQPKKKPADRSPKAATPAPAPVPVTDTAKDDKDDKADPKKKADTKPKNFDFTGLDLNGRMRTPQLLYFLERANEELERASLEKRTFIPHMVRSVEEEAL
ncbi:MAG TPA: hypothetical protein VIU61_23245 [Kofleriaceae bacterium]